MAPSLCPAGGRGLYSLLLRTPRELVGVFEGLWTERETLTRINKKGIEKYAVAYSYGDITGLVDPCWGRGYVDIDRSPCALINEPPNGSYANCIAESIFLEQEKEPEKRHQVWVVTGLPILPNDELFYHYGTEYKERDYVPGLPCPPLFNDIEPATELHPLL